MNSNISPPSIHFDPAAEHRSKIHRRSPPVPPTTSRSSSSCRQLLTRGRHQHRILQRPHPVVARSFATAVPSTVTLSLIFTVSFFQPPRTSAYGGPSSSRIDFVVPSSSFVFTKINTWGFCHATWLHGRQRQAQPHNAPVAIPRSPRKGIPGYPDPPPTDSSTRPTKAACPSRFE